MLNWTWHQWQEAAIFVVSVVTVAGLLLGLVIRLGRSHIDNRIKAVMDERDSKLDSKVTDAVKVAIKPLERQINNGLTSTIQRIEERQSGLLAQVSEMHGWMQATHARTPGDERRKELP